MLRFTLTATLVAQLAASAVAFDAIPEKLVVLTFDGSARSHCTVVRPILLKYRFGATFFVTPGICSPGNKTEYMTWEQIKQLHEEGFEVGYHIRGRERLSEKTLPRLQEQLDRLNRPCALHGIPKPTSLAYPSDSLPTDALTKLRDYGIRFARRGCSPEYPEALGRGFAYEPGLDHPLRIPSAGSVQPEWELEDYLRCVEQARRGRIAVLQFRRVRESSQLGDHATSEKFDSFMKYLAANGYHVIALRDLEKYVDSDLLPTDPEDVIKDRQHAIEHGESRDNSRPLPSGPDRRFWLENMAVYHQYSIAEIRTATGMTSNEVKAELNRFGLADWPFPQQKKDAPLTILPYPGGRHPRIGFLNGAIRPQRDTKFSVFAPWNDGGYAVVDLPEAIWWGTGDSRGLLYLAHVHPSAPPTWATTQGITLEPLEWTRNTDGSLEFKRALPNKVSFGAKVQSDPNSVRMQLWITNGTQLELTGLDVQNCVMLRGAPEFAQLTEENKVFHSPYVAVRNAAGILADGKEYDNCAVSTEKDVPACSFSISQTDKLHPVRNADAN